ncbi:MAG: propanediol utilization protein, partial [Verrucomicrobiaceae bacterium]|nr:propanediol utilization protein [Verrucomicrobiaceae bacterium]
GTAAFLPAYGDNTLAGTVSWMRPPVSASNAHRYKAGFAPLDLTAFGGRYLAPLPAKTTVAMGLPDSDNNAQLVFALGGIGGTTADPYAPMNPGLTLRLKIGGSSSHAANTDLTTLTVTPGSGAFTGSFKLSDPNPAIPAKLTLITRSVNFYGMIIPDAGVPAGEGYFLLPRRPAPPSPPAALQTLLTTDILSGRVVLQKFSSTP